MTTPGQASDSSTAADLAINLGGMPHLSEQLDRLRGQGVDTRDRGLWHSNALLAAADLMAQGGGRASAVNRNAAMVLASLLTLKDDKTQPVSLALHHDDGATAKIVLSLDPADRDKEDSPSSLRPDRASKRRLWIEGTRVPDACMETIIQEVAQATDSHPGDMPSLVGAGAVLACIQSMEAMNAARATFNFEGLGDDRHSFDFVQLRASIDPGPAPAPTRSRISLRS